MSKPRLLPDDCLDRGCRVTEWGESHVGPCPEYLRMFAEAMRHPIEPSYISYAHDYVAVPGWPKEPK